MKGLFIKDFLTLRRKYGPVRIAMDVLLIAVLWPFGLNGLWFNMAGTALLTCVVAVIILLDFKRRNWNSGTTR